MNQPKNAYAFLRMLLSLFALLITAGSLLVIFSTGWFLHWIAPDAAGQTGAMLVVFSKFIGVLGLFIAYLLYVTARDPVRHVAIIDALAGLLFLAAIMDLYALIALNFGAYYPAWAIWARAALRVAIGITLIAMRPRSARSTS